MLTLLSVLKGSLSTETFIASLRKCFVEVGLLEDENECFVKFNFKKKGFLPDAAYPAGAELGG